MELLADIGLQIAMILAMAVLAFVLLRRTGRYFKRRGKDDAHLVRVPRPKGRQSELLDSAGELIRYQVQLHDSAREIFGKLDTKIVTLELLLREARQQAERLERLMDQSQEQATAETATAETAGGVENPHAEIYALADQGFSAVTIAHRVAAPLSQVETILRERKG